MTTHDTPDLPGEVTLQDAPELPRITTGVPGLDHVAMGGFPLGRVAVVAGPAGSAKTVLAGQFLAAGTSEGVAGVFVTLEESPQDLRRNLSTLGFDIAAFEQRGDWAFVDGSPRYDAQLDAHEPMHIDTLLAQIGQALDRTWAPRVVLDSFGAALPFSGAEGAAARQWLRALLAELRRLGTTVVLTVETDHTGPTTFSEHGVEQYLADTVVLLRNSLEDESRRRTIEVLKMRGAAHRRGQFPFTILSGQGIVVLPISVQALDQGSTDTRVTSGNPDVDALCGGGFFRDSIILVSGATGTGKTLLTTEFLAGGVARGERSLMLAFEESHDQLHRNARGWGYDFQRAERDGLLKVVSTYPEVATLEDHLVEIKRAIEDFEPQRIAIDSLSALERIGTHKSFREFIIGLTSFVKAKQTVGLFSASTDTLLGGSSMTETHISTLTDSIILLRYVEVFGAVKRGMTVLKMRGSHHDRDIREYTIDGTGLHVGEPFRTVAGILSGNVVNLVPFADSIHGVLPPSCG
ncbi:MAG: circadian clock protein KaiC [Actinomycetes bacterium]